MAFYVVDQDEQKYGPADIATLNQWILEGRVLTTTILEDQVTSVRMVAISVPGLHFEGESNAVTSDAYPPPPQPEIDLIAANPFSRYAPGAYEFQLSLVLSVVAVFVPCWPFCPLMCAGSGLMYATRAKKDGHPYASLGIGLSSVSAAFIMFARFI